MRTVVIGQLMRAFRPLPIHAADVRGAHPSDPSIGSFRFATGSLIM